MDDIVFEFGTACEEVVEAAKARKKDAKPEQKAAAGENALRKMLGMRQKFRGIEELVDKRG